MPVILEREFEEDWLDVKTHDFDSLKQMLKPYPDDKMIAYAVSTEVNNPSNDNPELIRKVN